MNRPLELAPRSNSTTQSRCLLLDNEPVSSAKSLCAFALQAERLLVLQASSSIETQTRWGADTPASAGQKGIASQRVTADVYRDALCASLQEILQPDFDALTWTTGLISETAEMAPFTARKHLLKAGSFSENSRKSRPPSTSLRFHSRCIKTSKPTASQARAQPGTLAAWNKRRI
jgi:hypothetical protein